MTEKVSDRTRITAEIASYEALIKDQRKVIAHMAKNSLYVYDAKSVLVALELNKTLAHLRLAILDAEDDLDP